METIIDIYNTVISNTLYMIISFAFLILIGYGFIKKLFKFTLIIIVCTIGYLLYMYIYESPEKAADALDQIGQGIEQGFDAIEGAVSPILNISSPDSGFIKENLDKLTD